MIGVPPPPPHPETRATQAAKTEAPNARAKLAELAHPPNDFGILFIVSPS